MYYFEDYANVITVRELRELLCIGKNTAYELLASGRIPAVKAGRDWRISKDEVKRFVRGEREQGKA
jgi:excisionase family DNA binding protein